MSRRRRVIIRLEYNSFRELSIFYKLELSHYFIKYGGLVEKERHLKVVFSTPLSAESVHAAQSSIR